MPKYWGKQIFTHGSFPEVRQKQKTEKKREKDRKFVITMASYALQTSLRIRGGTHFYYLFKEFFLNSFNQF